MFKIHIGKKTYITHIIPPIRKSKWAKCSKICVWMSSIMGGHVGFRSNLQNEHRTFEPSHM